MSWLTDIVRDINSIVGDDLGGRIYIGSDINAIDTAYSESGNHNTCLFAVPLDTTYASDANSMFIKKRFACYIFVPKSDDPDGVDAWEICDDLAGRIADGLMDNGVETETEFLSGRVFREGRGYYIYVCEFATTIINGSTSGKSRVALYLYNGEVDGTAMYEKRLYTGCKVSKTYGVTRNTQGVDDNYTVSIFMPESEKLDIGQKSWVIVDGIGNVDKDYASQSLAETDGSRPFEINSWNYVKLGETIVGIEVNGV